MSGHQTRITTMLVAAGVLLSSACAPSASVARSSSVSRPLTPMAQRIDANRIQQLGATTAWDVLQTIAPVQSRDLRSMPTRRSATSVGSGITGVTAPRIIVDGVPLVDPGLLRTMPAADVIAIDLVGPLDAVMLFGQSYGGGAIVIRTRHETAPRGR